MHFAENQLYPGLKGISPLPTDHPMAPANGFGPPQGITPVSPCPWVARPVSGLLPVTNSPYSDSLSLRLRALKALNLAINSNSPAHYPKCTPSQEALPPRLSAAASPKGHTETSPALTACRHTVSGSISLPCPGFFSTFPRGTGALSVARGI